MVVANQRDLFRFTARDEAEYHPEDEHEGFVPLLRQAGKGADDIASFGHPLGFTSGEDASTILLRVRISALPAADVALVDVVEQSDRFLLAEREGLHLLGVADSDFLDQDRLLAITGNDGEIPTGSAFHFWEPKESPHYLLGHLKKLCSRNSCDFPCHLSSPSMSSD